MFYVCDEKDGKFGVKDSRDGVVEFYTVDELNSIKKNYGVRILGSHKNGGYFVIDIDEYQIIDVGTHNIYSFVNKTNKRIYIGVEDKKTGNVIYNDTDCSPFREDEEIFSKHKHGDLFLCINKGKKRKCLGFGLHLIDSCKDEYSLEFYIEIPKDGNVELIHYEDWTRSDYIDDNYIYNPDTDRIEIEDNPPRWVYGL